MSRKGFGVSGFVSLLILCVAFNCIGCGQAMTYDDLAGQLRGTESIVDEDDTYKENDGDKSDDNNDKFDTEELSQKVEGVKDNVEGSVEDAADSVAKKAEEEANKALLQFLNIFIHFRTGAPVLIFISVLSGILILLGVKKDKKLRRKAWVMCIFGIPSVIIFLVYGAAILLRVLF